MSERLNGRLVVEARLAEIDKYESTHQLYKAPQILVIALNAA